METIVISYRRRVEYAAGNLGRELSDRFGKEHILRDKEGISPGADWKQRLLEPIRAGAALIVLVDEKWLTDDGERLANPGDIVRLEIAEGIKNKTFILPVLLGSATMPDRAALPEDLRPLCDFQAAKLRDGDWDHDILAVCAALQRAGFQPKRVFSWRRVLVAAIVLAATVVAGTFWLGLTQGPTASVATSNPARTTEPGAIDAIREFLFPEPPVQWSVVFSLPWQLQPAREYMMPTPDRHTAVVRATVTNRGSHPATILDTGFVLGEGDSQWDPLRSSRPFDGFTIGEKGVKSIEIQIPFELPAAQDVAPRSKTGAILSESDNGMVPIGLYVLTTDARGDNHDVFFPIAYGLWENRRFTEIVPLTGRYNRNTDLSTVELLKHIVIRPSDIVGRWRDNQSRSF